MLPPPSLPSLLNLLGRAGPATADALLVVAQATTTGTTATTAASPVQVPPAQTGPPPGWEQILGPFGVLVVLLGIVWFGGRAWSSGTLRPGRDVDDLKKSHETEMAELRADYEKRLAEQRADYDQRLTEAKRDEEWWRGRALDALGVGEQLIARQRRATEGGRDGA